MLPDRNMKMINQGLYQFHVPISWDMEFLRNIEVLAQQSSNTFSFTVYGSAPRQFATGRPNDIPEVDRGKIKSIFQDASKRGYKTKYLLNGVHEWSDMYSENGYLSWVCNVLKADSLCVSTPQLARRLVSEFGVAKIAVSTIAGWLSSSGTERWFEDSILQGHLHSVSLHHDFSNQFDNKVAEFVEKLRLLGVEPNVLVTESCSTCCSVRDQHYAFFGQNSRTRWTQNFLDPYQVACVLNRLQRPETLLDLAGFLPPSRLDEFFNRTGIKEFKFSGRSMPSDWVLNCVKHYAERRDPVNIFELVVFTTPFLHEIGMTSSDLFFLDADSYQELYDELMGQPIASSGRRQWLQNKAAKLFEEGKLCINDPGSVYSVKGNAIHCVKPGEYSLLLKTALQGRVESHKEQVRVFCA